MNKNLETLGLEGLEEEKLKKEKLEVATKILTEIKEFYSNDINGAELQSDLISKGMLKIILENPGSEGTLRATSRHPVFKKLPDGSKLEHQQVIQQLLKPFTEADLLEKNQVYSSGSKNPNQKCCEEETKSDAQTKKAGPSADDGRVDRQRFFSEESTPQTTMTISPKKNTSQKKEDNERSDKCEPSSCRICSIF